VVAAVGWAPPCRAPAVAGQTAASLAAAPAASPPPRLTSHRQRHSKECGGGRARTCSGRSSGGIGWENSRSARANGLVSPCWSRVELLNACPSWVRASRRRQPLFPHHPHTAAASAYPSAAPSPPGSPARPARAPYPDWASPRPAPSVHRRRRWSSRTASPTLRDAPGLRPLPAWVGCPVGVAPPPPAAAGRAALPVCGAHVIEKVRRPDGTNDRRA